MGEAPAGMMQPVQHLLTVPVSSTTRPAYNPSMDFENDPESVGGILDLLVQITR